MRAAIDHAVAGRDWHKRVTKFARPGREPGREKASSAVAPFSANDVQIDHHFGAADTARPALHRGVRGILDEADHRLLDRSSPFRDLFEDFVPQIMSLVHGIRI